MKLGIIVAQLVLLVSGGAMLHYLDITAPPSTATGVPVLACVAVWTAIVTTLAVLATLHRQLFAALLGATVASVVAVVVVLLYDAFVLITLPPRAFAWMLAMTTAGAAAAQLGACWHERRAREARGQ